MYAHKLHHNVPYNDWDKADPHVNYALGSFLEPIIDVKQLPSWLKDRDTVNTLRRRYMTPASGANKGQLLPYSSWRNTSLEIWKDEDNNVFLEHTPDCIKETYLGCTKLMHLQLWIAHSSLRVPGAMILDPLDWDNVPKALDEIEIARPVVKKKIDIPF